jgi:hypothetical protein
VAHAPRVAQIFTEAGILPAAFHHAAERLRDDRPRLYAIDASGLAATSELDVFVHSIRPADRALLVSDGQPRRAVTTGRLYRQLQDAGMHIARLDAPAPKRDAPMGRVFDLLVRDDVASAIHELAAQGRLRQIADRGSRLWTIAREYLRQSRGTLVVSLDADSRTTINRLIHDERAMIGELDRREHHVRVLAPRQVSAADRGRAAHYDVGDVVRYRIGNRALGLDTGEYARVTHVDAERNLVTVRRSRGTAVTYDPGDLQGVALYREADRTFARGDRVQFTACNRARKIGRFEVGTIDSIDGTPHVRVRLDSGRRVTVALTEPLHLDYGYAVAGLRGQTADRVLVHFETDRLGEPQTNRSWVRLAISGGRYEAQIYTDNVTALHHALGRDPAHPSRIAHDRAWPARARDLGLAL